MHRQRFLTALLCGAALLAFACGGNREAEQVDAKTETEPAETWQIVDEPAENAAQESNELRPEPKEVRIEPRDLEREERETELAEREQRLAERQAELAARERELREREASTQARRSPEPEPRAEPVEEPEPAEDTEEVAEAEPVEDRFEEEAQPEPAEEERAERTPALVATVPAGTVMEAELLEELSSNGSAAGDTFRARLVSGVEGDGGVAIPAGSEVVGVVEEAVPLARRVGGKARLTLRFTDLVLPSGATVPIRASLVEQGRSETRKDAATIGGAAAGGAILGRILNGKNRSRGAVIGAIIGAAAGTVIASRTPGEEVVFPEGTVVSLNLDRDVEVRSR